MVEEKAFIRVLDRDSHLKKMAMDFLRETAQYKYTYHFSWLGLPIIQLPQDILAIQEIIWQLKPDLVIETGIAHGGSLILSASILELIGGEGEVLGIDIDIRDHNRAEIEGHSLSKRITMIQGSSTEKAVVGQVRALAEKKQCVLVMLDSNHTHEHVLGELELYSQMVTRGSYLIVFDTAIEDMPPDFYLDRPWGKGNNPKTAVFEFLKTNDRFVIDKDVENKLLITVAPDGYLKCIRD